jgi:hypothetical protein
MSDISVMKAQVNWTLLPRPRPVTLSASAHRRPTCQIELSHTICRTMPPRPVVLRAAGVPDYGPDSLREDFARFRFLLGFTDGEGLVTPDDA